MAVSRISYKKKISKSEIFIREKTSRPAYSFRGVYMQSKINTFLNYCYNDTEKPSIEFQLFLITVKCLMPYEDKIGCFFDVGRYKKEIELFAYYKNGNDDVIDYRIENKVPSYKEDMLFEYKIIPIILSNTVWDNLIDEVFKAVTFYTLNVNTILNSILVSSLIFEYFTGEKDIIQTKERLIELSIKDFLNKNNFSVDKKYIIDFEKERIKILSKGDLLYGIDYKSLNYILNNSDSNSDSNIVEKEIIESYSSYLNKLRTGKIAPEKLKIPDIMPNIEECLKQPLFNHPLLGRCKVIERTENEVYIRNKSGIMRIKI